MPELARRLDSLTEQIKRLTKEKGELEAQLLCRLQFDPYSVPSYCIKRRYGNRAWSVLPPVVKFVLSGVRVELTVLKTPAALERAGVDKDLLAGLTDRPFLGEYLEKVK